MSDYFKNFIDGEWVESASGETFKSINPADTRRVLGEFQRSNKEDVDRAVDAAHRAFESWRSVPAPERGRLIARVFNILSKKVDELALIMTEEEGKILAEAKGEVIKGLNLLEFYSGEGFRIQGETLPSELRDSFIYTIRQPLGVCAIITPWNFPFAIPCWKIAPALVAGNTVVFKPASWTPLMALKIVEAFEEAGVPKGVLNMVTGPGSLAGDALVKNPKVKAVSFTGSTEIGREINKTVAERLVKITCEMGGKNPVVVMEDADLKLAVDGIIKGAFGSTGQRCTATSRLIAVKKIHDEIIDMIKAGAEKIKVGPGWVEGVTMGPAVSKEQLETDLYYIGVAKEEGAELVMGGKRLTGGDYDYGYFIEPTIFKGVTREMRIFKEEVFGPVLSVIKAEDFEEALDLANDCRYGLSSSIYTRNPDYIMRFVQGIEAGMTHINSPTIGGEAQIPFGGIKDTGVGEREMGRWGLNFFTELKVVFYEYSGKKRETNIY